MAVRNGAATVGATLASVAGQTRPPDAVVVVDDGSDDQTAEVVRSWQGRLPLALLHHRQSQGPAGARNRALAALDTELVVFLDGDDLWLPNHIEVLATTYNREPGIAACRYLWWSPDTGLSRRSSADIRPVPPTNQMAVLLQHNFVPLSSLCSRSAVVSAGGFGPFRGTEDWDLWLRMVRQGIRVSAAPVVTMLYRTGEATLSSAPGFHDEEIAVLEQFLAAGSDPTWRRAATGSLRRHRAARALQESHQQISRGHSWGARQAALGALASPGRTRWHGLAMVAVPGLVHRFTGHPAERRRRLVGLQDH
jgi:hypothetical protein